jgi:hypothetical protein
MRMEGCIWDAEVVSQEERGSGLRRGRWLGTRVSELPLPLPLPSLRC